MMKFLLQLSKIVQLRRSSLQLPSEKESDFHQDYARKDHQLSRIQMGPSIRMPGPNVHKVQADLENRRSFHRPFVRFLYLKRHFNVWPTHSREQRSLLSIIGYYLQAARLPVPPGLSDVILLNSS